MPYLMALDQGTSSSRAIIYGVDGTVVEVAQQPFEMIFPADGWVEQDPEVLWQSIVAVGRAAIQASHIEPHEIVGIGITNQRETSLLWRRENHQPVHNAIVWQDRRTAERCRAMTADQCAGQPLEDYLAQTTGLVIDPYFSSTKLAWMLDQVEGARTAAQAGTLAFGTVDTFLIWRLTGGKSHVTDATNASRTQLFDINSQAWSEPLLDYFAIPAAIMPQVLDSAADFGVADPEWFGAPIPICGVAGDQQAALVGQGCFRQGMTKSTYGTGCFVMTNTGATPVTSGQRLLTTVAYRLKGQTTYALEGSIFVAGVAIKWLRDQLKLIETPADTAAAFAATGGDSKGVFVVPAFTGLGAPHWQPNVRGTITGLTLDSSREHLITAFLQSVVYQTETLFAAMAADGAEIDALRVDGGMVVNDALCQFLADVLATSVERPTDIETTARGAAMLAGLGAGLYADLDAAAQTWRCERRFEPLMAAEQREQLLQGYAHAVAQALA